MMRRPTIVRCPLPRRPRFPDPRAHTAGTAAVERALFPLAADLRASLAGRRSFPRSLIAAEAVGATHV